MPIDRERFGFGEVLSNQSTSKNDEFKNKSETLPTKPKHYTVTRDYKSPYPDQIFFQKGEKVEIGQEFKEDPDWKNWIWCEGSNKKKAWVPRQYVNIDGRIGVFNEDYDARELSVQIGEELVVYEIVNGFGMSEKTDGMKGWVPIRNMKIEKK